MRQFYSLSLALVFGLLFSTINTVAQTLPATPCNFMQRVGSFTSANGAEISAFDPVSKRLYTVAGAVVEFQQMSNTGSLSAGGVLPLSFTPPATANAVPNSVAVSNGIVAVSYAIVSQATNAQQPGRVAFYNASTGAFLNVVEVGFLPDMVTFTPDGTKVLTANEGEPNSYNQPTSFDPEGSISIIDISGGVAAATVQTAGFTSFNSQIAALRAAGVRIYGPNATVAQDLEPEYITISPDGTTAVVTLQENNAIAIVNIPTATVTSIVPLGLKNHNLPGNGLDASDRDVNFPNSGSTGKINIQNWPVFGMYQPDAIAQFTVGGQTYYITANEGDSRDYPGYSEERRVGASNYLLDPTVFPNAATLKLNQNLGRLTVTIAGGDIDNDNDFDRIQVLGARSFSIWNASGTLVYDSKDEMEVITSILTPSTFNSDGTAATFDTRSDNKGPEPEGVAIGVIDGVPYAFIGLERVGDILVYNVSNPAAPVFVQYINTPEDLAVEGVTFIPADKSPTGKPLVITSAEVSRTISVYEVNVPSVTVTETSGIANNDGIICEGATVTLTSTGNAPYLWSTGATTQSITISPTATTTYSVSSCYLSASTTITVNRANNCSITAVPSNNIFTGGVPTNIYLGYGPQSVTLNVNAADAGAPYTYTWSGSYLSNNNTANPVFTPLLPGNFTLTLTLTNQFGCTSTCSITICVTDIRVPGTDGKKVYVCHAPPGNPAKAKTIEISVNAVDAHLRNQPDSRLGKCGTTPCSSNAPGRFSNEITGTLLLKALPNPTSNSFTLQLQSNKSETAEIRVMDMQGRIVFSKRVASNSIVTFGNEFVSGIYLLQVNQGAEIKTMKLVKQ
jgi:hypothetical protein